MVCPWCFRTAFVIGCTSKQLLKIQKEASGFNLGIPSFVKSFIKSVIYISSLLVTISYQQATYLISYCFTVMRNALNERLLPLSAVDHCLCTLKMVNRNMDTTASKERKLTLFSVGVTILYLKSLGFCWFTLYVDLRNIAPKGFSLYFMMTVHLTSVNWLVN